MLHFPYRSTHGSSDYDQTFTSYCKHVRGGFGNLKVFKIVLAGVPGVCPTGAHSVHPIAMKLSQIVGNMLAVVLEIYKIKKCTSWSIWCCPTFRSWLNFAHLSFQTREKSLSAWPSLFPITTSWRTRCFNVVRDELHMQLASKVTDLLIFSSVSYKITTTMRVHLQVRYIVATFPKQLLDNGNEKLAIDSVTKYISFPSNFCTVVPSTQ